MTDMNCGPRWQVEMEIYVFHKSTVQMLRAKTEFMTHSPLKPVSLKVFLRKPYKQRGLFLPENFLLFHGTTITLNGRPG